jgi:hypothetical protein
VAVWGGPVVELNHGCLMWSVILMVHYASLAQPVNLFPAPAKAVTAVAPHPGVIGTLKS